MQGKVSELSLLPEGNENGWTLLGSRKVVPISSGSQGPKGWGSLRLSHSGNPSPNSVSPKSEDSTPKSKAPTPSSRSDTKSGSRKSKGLYKELESPEASKLRSESTAELQALFAKVTGKLTTVKDKSWLIATVLRHRGDHGGATGSVMKKPRLGNSRPGSGSVQNTPMGTMQQAGGATSAKKASDCGCTSGCREALDLNQPPPSPALTSLAEVACAKAAQGGRNGRWGDSDTESNEVKHAEQKKVRAVAKKGTEEAISEEQAALLLELHKPRSQQPLKGPLGQKPSDEEAIKQEGIGNTVGDLNHCSKSPLVGPPGGLPMHSPAWSSLRPPSPPPLSLNEPPRKKQNAYGLGEAAKAYADEVVSPIKQVLEELYHKPKNGETLWQRKPLSPPKEGGLQRPSHQGGLGLPRNIASPVRDGGKAAASPQREIERKLSLPLSPERCLDVPIRAAASPGDPQRVRALSPEDDVRRRAQRLLPLLHKMTVKELKQAVLDLTGQVFTGKDMETLRKKVLRVAQGEDGRRSSHFSRSTKSHGGASSRELESDAEKARTVSPDKARRLSPNADKARALSPNAEKARVIPPSADKARMMSPHANKARVISPTADKARVISPSADQATVISPSDDKARVISANADKARVVLPNADKARVISPSADKERVISPNADKARVVSPNADKARVIFPNADEARMMSPHVDMARVVSPAGGKAKVLSPPADLARLLLPPEKPRVLSPNPDKARIFSPSLHFQKVTPGAEVGFEPLTFERVRSLSSDELGGKKGAYFGGVMQAEIANGLFRSVAVAPANGTEQLKVTILENGAVPAESAEAAEGATWQELAPWCGQRARNTPRTPVAAWPNSFNDSPKLSTLGRTGSSTESAEQRGVESEQGLSKAEAQGLELKTSPLVTMVKRKELRVEVEVAQETGDCLSEEEAELAAFMAGLHEARTEPKASVVVKPKNGHTPAVEPRLSMAASRTKAEEQYDEEEQLAGVPLEVGAA